MKKLVLLVVLSVACPAWAQELYLREDTASQGVTIGPFLDPADGTAEGGLTISNTDVRLKLDGAADVAKNSGSCTHDVNGMYDCTFDATDTADSGNLNVSVCETGAVCWARTYFVLEQNVYDILFPDAATLGTRVNEIDDILADTGTDGVQLPAGEVDDAALGTITEVGTAVWANGTRVLTAATNLGHPTNFSSLSIDGEGDVNASVTEFGGTNGTFASGIPAVNTTQISGDSAPADELEAIYEGVCGQFGRYGVLRGFGCTATSYTHSTGVVVLDGASAFADGALQNALITLCGNTSGCQSAQIASNLLSGDAVTLQDPLEDDIEGETITFTIFGTPQTTASATVEGDVNLVTVEGADATTYFATLDDATATLIGSPAGGSVATAIQAVEDQTDDIGAAGVGLTAADDAVMTRLGTPAGASVSADIVVLDNFVDDLEARVGTPSNLGGGATVAGNLSDIEGQTDDIGVAGAGLTAADDTVVGLVDDIGVAGAGLSAIPDQTINLTGTWTGNISGNVTGSVGSVTGLTASDVGAIKTKTDSLTFTVAGLVDSNVRRVNGVTITGNGSSQPFAVSLRSLRKQMREQGIDAERRELRELRDRLIESNGAPQTIRVAL